MSRTTSATNDGGIAAELWNWARGCHSTEAAVEFRRGLRMVVSSDQEVAIGLGPVGSGLSESTAERGRNCSVDP